MQSRLNVGALSHMGTWRKLASHPTQMKSTTLLMRVPSLRLAQTRSGCNAGVRQDSDYMACCAGHICTCGRCAVRAASLAGAASATVRSSWYCSLLARGSSVRSRSGHTVVWYRCVEVGCGSGYVICSVARLIQKAGHRAHHVALDVSAPAVQATRCTLAAHMVRVQLCPSCYMLAAACGLGPCPLAALQVRNVDVTCCDLVGPLAVRLRGCVDLLVRVASLARVHSPACRQACHITARCARGRCSTRPMCSRRRTRLRGAASRPPGQAGRGVAL